MTKTFLSRVLAVAMVFSMVSSNGGFLQILTARATGYRTTVSATLNGGSSTTVTPSATITVTVTGTISGNDSGDWHGTEWRINTASGSMACKNTADHDNAGTFTTEQFTITAPSTPGTYNAYFRINGRGSCNTDEQGTLLALTNAVIVTPPPKPDLTATKTNNLGGNNAIVSTPFNWIITISNSGNATADFENNGLVFKDNLPLSGANYGTPSAVKNGGVTGDIICSLDGNQVFCKSGDGSSHRLHISASSNITVTVPVTPTSAGTLVNPKDGGVCQVDPNGHIDESNEGNNNCSNTVTIIAQPICGDNVKNGTEECDGQDGVGVHQSCSALCTLVDEPWCGNGVKEGTEECDGTDGIGEHQSCNDTCTLIDVPYCGNGTVNPGEACDDGDVSDGDGCTANCTVESGWTCTDTQPSVCTQNPVSPETNCSDTIDNDGDTFTDCADSDCVNDPVCNPVTHYGCSPIGAGCVVDEQGSFTTSDCNGQCGGPNNLPIEIIAKKVICAAEQYLPNWGNGGPDIDGNTAQTYVTESQQKCWLEDQWGFEWALGNVSNPGDNIIGPAGGSWTSFGTGSANSAMISDLGGTDKIWVREILPNADYIDFTGANTTQDVSAEFYCASDVLNYDNYDYINNPQYQSTYNCVGFNALKQRCGNGVREGTEECDGADGVNPTANLDFCSTSCNLVPIYNGGTECPEGTKPEKVGNTYIINSSNATETEVTVEEDKQYVFEVSGTFSPTSAQGYLSDAGYTLVNDVLSTQYGIQGTPPDYAAHALLGNLGLDMGVINWGAYNPDHLYDFSYTIPTGTTTAKFVVGDRYGDWFNTPYQMQAGIGDNIGTLNLDVYKCISDIPPVESDVTICKQDPQQNLLSGWNMILKSSLVEDLTVYPYNEAKNNFALVTSSDLPTGNYIVEANGQYVYRPGTLGAEYSDAGYSKRLCPGDAPALCSGLYSPWANVITFDPPYQGYLGLMINESATDWGYFNSNHKYVLGYPGHTGLLSFTIKDDQYSDNSGSLTASIYNGYAGVTGVNGCVTFANVPVGTYSLEEIMQNDWQNVSGLETVTVDDETETFYVVNDIIRKGDIAGYKYNDLDRDGNWDEQEPGLGGWNICIDGNKDGDCDDAEDNPQTTTNQDGFYSFRAIPIGTYQVCEVTSDHSGWGSQNSPCQEVEVVDGVETQANFFNYEEVIEEPKGSLIICKYRDYEVLGQKGENDTPLAWDMTVLYPGQGGTLSTRTNGESGCITIPGLPYGEYSVTESSQSNWTKTYPADSLTQTTTINETTPNPTVYFLNQYTPGPASTYIGPVGTSGGTTGSGASPAVAGASTESGSEPAEEVLGASTGTCDLYLYKYIKLGANNDPEEVRKLQLFLNEYLNLNLPVDGIYSQDDYDAVVTFQLTYKDDILKPWADLGLLSSANDPTGYVYRTTQRKINLIVCPGLGLAMPDLTDEIGGRGGFGAEGSVLGESTEAITTTSTTVTTATTKPEDESVIGALEETGGKNLNWFLIFMGLLIVGGGLYALVLRKKK